MNLGLDIFFVNYFRWIERCLESRVFLGCRGGFFVGGGFGGRMVDG